MKLCEWIQRIRQRLRPSRRDRFAGDNSRYIASARRHCLLILALGLVATQSARDESRYQAAQGLYSYVEKVLVVANAIRTGEWETRDTPLKVGHIPEVPEGLEVLRPMAGDSAFSELVKFTGRSGTLATTADPTNNCDPQVYRLDAAPVDGQEKLALWVLLSLNSGDDFQAKFEDAFVVWFDSSCPELRDLIDTFLVVSYGEPGRSEGVVLSDDILRRLGIYWLRSPSEVMSEARAKRTPEAVPHLSDDQEERLSEFDRKQLTTLDLTLLEGIVLTEARAATQRTYAIGEVDAALQAILEDPGADKLDMWGLRIPADLLPLSFPIALLSLAFSLLYRLRCIDPSRDILEEPWVVVIPHGTVERVGAAAWSITPLIAAAGVIWATWAHHPLEQLQTAWRLEMSFRTTGDVSPFEWWLMKTSLVWSLVVEFVAVVFLLQATVWMIRIGYRDQGGGTSVSRRPRMTAETLRYAQRVVSSRERSIATITRALGLPPGTLYRYLYADGRLKRPGRRLLEL